MSSRRRPYNLCDGSLSGSHGLAWVGSGIRNVCHRGLVGWTLIILALVAMGFTLAAAAASHPGRTYAAETRPHAGDPAQTAYLAEPGLEEICEAFLQDYDGTGSNRVWRPLLERPALKGGREVARRISGRRRGNRRHHSRLSGSNRKWRTYQHGGAVARHEMLVMSDSDIRVQPDYLSNVRGRHGRAAGGSVFLPLFAGRWDISGRNLRRWESIITFSRMRGFGMALALPSRVRFHHRVPPSTLEESRL